MAAQNRLYHDFAISAHSCIKCSFSCYRAFYDVIAFPPLLQAYIPNYVLVCACLCCSSIWLQRPAALHCTLPIPQSFSCQGTLPAYWLLPKSGWISARAQENKKETIQPSAWDIPTQAKRSLVKTIPVAPLRGQTPIPLQRSWRM